MNRININSKSIVTTLIFSIISMSSMAQVNKQVEVTKAYIPQIESATKLRLEPDMSDTVRLEPEIDYSVTPKSIEMTLSPHLYTPATVTYWEFNRPKRNYIKAGLGYPLASVADVYVSNANPNMNYIVGYLNHQGQYSKLTNDYGDKLSGLNSQNRLGVAAGVILGERTLEGEFSYDIDTWSRYATLNSITPRPLYQTLSLSGRYGDEFIDFAKWNYNFEVDAKYFFGRDDSNAMVGVGANFAKDLSKGRFSFDLGYDYISGSGKYLNNSISLGATYAFTSGAWNWEVGGVYYNDKVTIDSLNSSRNYILPHFSLKNSSDSCIKPFIEIDGVLNRYNYYSLVELNPYVLEGFMADENSVEYNIRGGIEGVADEGRFSYRLFGEYSIDQNALFWALNEVSLFDSEEISNYYTAKFGELYKFTVGGNLEYYPIGDLKFELCAFLHKYSTSKVDDVATGRPYSNIYIGGVYKFGRVKIGLSADINGVSYTTLYVTDDSDSMQTTNSNIKIPTNVNLKAFAEVKIKNDMVLFVEGDNLTNSALYDWMGYRKYGIGVMGGVKFQF
ncbi:MAG: hypothetical protein SNG27_03185 [Rikenellaceae bacterium]